VLGLVALFVALGGTALAATGQLVNIADKTTAANVARVDAAGKLYVGDGAGALTVDGTVAASPVPPKVSVASIGYASAAGCSTVYSPPAGKTLVLTGLTVQVNRSSGGTFAEVDLFKDTSCGTAFDFVTNYSAEDIIQRSRDYGPGVVLPDGFGSYAYGSSGVISFNGYLVPDGSATASSLGAQSTADAPTGPVGRP
jgi:hypothetical protein